MKKRVIFHIGTHKTGSSALQSWFSENQQALLSAGVDYPYPDPPVNVLTGNCCGNFLRAIQSFAPALQHETLASRIYTDGLPVSLPSIVDYCVSSDQETILFSGETLSVLSKNSIEELHRAFAPFFEITVICVVRDLFDYSFSLWKQLIKMLRTNENYRAWLDVNMTNSNACQHPDDRYLFNLRAGLITYLDHFSDVRFINYDFHSKRLTKQFFKTAGIDLQTDIDMKVGHLSNPSLSDSQAYIQQLVNARFGSTYLPHVISNAFTSTAQQPGEIKLYDPDAHKDILAYFSSVLASLNTGLPPLEQLDTSTRPQPLTEPAIAISDIDNLLSQLFLATEKNGLGRYLAAAMAFLNCKVLPIPLDFNAKTYLRLNHDLSQANVNPFIHYFRHGRREGRAYKML